MNWKLLTRIVIITAVVALLLYDLIAVIFGGIQSTISMQFYLLSKRYLTIPFALGFLACHLLTSPSGE